MKKVVAVVAVIVMLAIAWELASADSPTPAEVGGTIQYASEVVYVQYASEPVVEEVTPEPIITPEPVSVPPTPTVVEEEPVDPNPTGRLQDEFIGETIDCSDFSGHAAAQAFLDANPKSYVMLDPERDGLACKQAVPGTPVPKPEPKRVAGGCYPSCQYEALQKLTPDQREAIGAARYMPPFERK